MKKIAFIGLGVMGAPMAAHLVKAGRTVTAATRTPGKAEAWAARTGGNWASSPAAAVKGADAVITMVRDDRDLEALFDEGGELLNALQPGCLVVDHTSASPLLARRLAPKLGRRGVMFADAPVSGGQAGAEAGRLSIMAGAPVSIFSKVCNLVGPYAASVHRIGEVGSGQAAKLVNQVCIAGTLQGLAEGLALGCQLGIDMDAALGAISGGAAQSWQMDNRAMTMMAGEFDFGFSVDLMLKDMLLALSASKDAYVDMPVTRLVANCLRDLSESGKGQFDNSSLILRLLTAPARAA